MLDKMAAQSHNKSKRWLVTIIFYDTEEKNMFLTRDKLFGSFSTQLFSVFRWNV